MKTYNIVYTDDKALLQFINEKNFIDYNNILIQIYTTIHDINNIKDLLNILNSNLPNAKIIGCKTVETIFDAEGLLNQCIISITLFDNTTILQKSYIKEDISDYEIGLQLSKQTCCENTKLAIMIVSNYDLDFEQYILGFNKLYPNVIISGGMAPQVEDVFVFDNNNVYKNAIVCVTLNNKNLNVHNYIINGIEPIGSEYEVTKIDGNIIEKINNIPAQDWYKKYLGNEIFSSKYMATERFPLVVGENPALVRAVGYAKNNFLYSLIKLKIGDKLRIGYGNIKQTIEECKFVCNELSKVYIESLFVFSCSGRRHSMKECSSWELKPFKQNNLIGFFTGGELASLNNKNYIFNNACTFLGLSENNKKKLNLNFKVLEQISELDSNSNKVLTFLIHDINKDLFNKNKVLIKKILEQNEQIKEKLLTDELTKLDNINKYNFDISINNYNKIAIIDITNFKVINSFYGNKLGDKVLIKIGEFFEEYASKCELKLYNFSVDIFAFTCNSTIENQKFIYLMEQIHNITNSKCFIIDTFEIFFNVNVALVLDEENIYDKAMILLDYLKRTNESFLIYNKNLKIEKLAEDNFMWINKIKKAIQEDKIIPYFQPIYNNKTNIYDKYEALIRLIDEDNNIIPPQYFLDIAKKTNLYKNLTKIMINKTFNFFKDKDYQFSINITVDDITDSGVKNYILYKLELFPKPQNVIFELVETDSIEQYSEVKEFILNLKKMGAKIAIDDFGTGYSNLMYLVQLDIDIIKVDGSIIKNLYSDNYSNLITNMVIYLANNLNIETVAEYVEDRNIFNKVKDMGIQYSQGYYFSKPKKDI